MSRLKSFLHRHEAPPSSLWASLKSGWGGLVGIANVRVLGAGSDSALFEELDLAVWGRAHVDYDDMAPLADPSPRLARRHVAAAHGHFVEARPAPGRPGAAWLITP